MTEFKLHTPETASSEGQEALNRAEKEFGFAPNLLKTLAEAPAAAHAYLDLGARLGKSTLAPAEQQVVLLATSLENECDYCMAAHTMGAEMAGVDEKTRSAMRKGDELPDPRLNALWGFTRGVVKTRGRVSEEDLTGFIDAGFTRANVLEVVTGVAMKTLSNYTNHLAETPLDEAFEGARWTPPGAAKD